MAEGFAEEQLSEEQDQATYETQDQSTESPPETKHNFDAGLSKVQAKIAQLDRDGVKKSDLEELKSALLASNPSTKEDDLELADDELPQVGTLKAVEKRISDKVAAIANRTEELAQRQETEKFWIKENKINPGLDCESVYSDAQDEVRQEYPGASPDSLLYATDLKYKQLLKSRKGTQTKQDPKPSTKPRESTDGADIKPESAESAEKGGGVERDRFGLPVNLF
jgi:hypothetical protein